MPIYDLSRYLLLLKPDFFRGIDCGGKSFQQDIWRLWQKGLIGKSVVLTPAQLPDSSTDYERMAILILSGQAKGLEKSQITIPFNFSRGGILRADPLQWIGSSARGQREASLQITFKTNQHASPLKLRIHGSAQKNHELVLQSNTLGVETVEGAYQAFQTTLPVAHDTHWLKLELFDDNGTLAESYLPVVQ
jgi:hypothetical protein